METSNPRKQVQASTMWDPKIMGPAVWSAFAKLNPALMIKNPVMFVVEVVAALTTVIFLRDLATGGADLAFTLQIIVWLWSDVFALGDLFVLGDLPCCEKSVPPSSW
jgi:potassium-transporting ATPase ATP-binding subunit